MSYIPTKIIVRNYINVLNIILIIIIFSIDLITVKIFIGIEYECIRGHRFMSSAPGKMLKASGSGMVKENASKITKGNMPLYLPCPCGLVILNWYSIF